MNKSSIPTALMVPVYGSSILSPFPPGQMERSLDWMRRHGFSGVEPIIPAPSAVNASELKMLFSRYQLSVTTIVTGQTSPLDPLSLCSPDESIRQKTVSRLLEHIELAHELKANVTLGLVKGTCTYEQRKQATEFLKFSLEPLIHRAETLDVTLLLEPINHTKSGFLNSSLEIKQFICSFFQGAPLKILYDTFQSNIEDYHVTQVLKDIPSYLGHVHFADSNRKFPGLGNIDFQAVYNQLKAIGYSGFITLESFNVPDGSYLLSHAEALFSALCQGSWTSHARMFQLAAE